MCTLTHIQFLTILTPAVNEIHNIPMISRHVHLRVPSDAS